MTAWTGENHFAPLPVALYGIVLLFCGIAYFILTRALISHHGRDSILAIALGRDTKGKISIVIYALAALLAFIHPGLAFMMYVLVAILWLIPDRRIEKAIALPK